MMIKCWGSFRVEKIKGVAYARYSSDRQREESIEAQLRKIHEYADRNNIVIIKEYIDRAISGKYDYNRVELKNMLKDSEKHLFEVLLVDKVDRFARNRYDAAMNKHKLKENGVKVKYVSQQISDSPEGVMMEAMLEGMAEYYSSNLATETIKGLKENAYDCRHCGGKPPLGYDVDPQTRRYVTNNNEANIIKIIYRMYQDGSGYTEIINYLNSKGYKTKYGSTFGKNSIYEILRNEKYTGTYIFNKAPREFKGKKNKRVRNNEDDIIKIEGGMPVIIEFDEWKAVQNKMDSKKKPGRKSNEIYLLSGSLHCGVCGSAMTADTRYLKNREQTYCYYRCYKNNGKNNCNLQAWSRDDLEAMVLSELESKFFSKDNINNMVEKIYNYYADLSSDLNKDIRLLRHDLEGIDRKINNIVEALSDGQILQSLKNKLKDLEDQRIIMESQIEEKELTIKFQIPSREVIYKYIKNSGNFKSLNRTELKSLVNAYIKDITIYPDRVDVDIFVNIVGCGSPYTTRFTINI